MYALYVIVMDCFIEIGSTYINTIQLKIQMLNKGNGLNNRIEMLKEIEKHTRKEKTQQKNEKKVSRMEKINKKLM